MQAEIRRAFPHLVTLITGITLVVITTYMNAQQEIRQSANEPQGWISDTTVSRLTQGELPEKAVASDQVPIETSSAPYVVIYDSEGNPIAGTGYLHGALPHIPLGIFDTARYTTNRITWQPEPGLREAIVVKPANGEFVMVGRSLAYTERQENGLLVRTVIGWILTLLGVIAVFVLCSTLQKKHRI